MSERYTCTYDHERRLSFHDGTRYLCGKEVAEVLNAHDRLAAQVETLREVLKDVLLFIRHDSAHTENCPGCIVDARIDAALADTETKG